MTAGFTRDLHLSDPEATARLGRALGAELRPGDTVLLDGEIGAGKTHLARAAIQAVLAAEGIAEDVPSPTFTLVQTYDSRRGQILHADLYRLRDPRDLDDTGLTDALGRAICLVEWPALLEGSEPPDALRIGFRIGAAEGTRQARLSAASPRWRGFLATAAGGLAA